MEYGYTRKILECAVDEVEIIARPTYTRVGVKTGENRIHEPLAANAQRLQQQGYDYYSFFQMSHIPFLYLTRSPWA